MGSKRLTTKSIWTFLAEYYHEGHFQIPIVPLTLEWFFYSKKQHTFNFVGFGLYDPRRIPLPSCIVVVHYIIEPGRKNRVSGKFIAKVYEYVWVWDLCIELIRQLRKYVFRRLCELRFRRGKMDSSIRIQKRVWPSTAHIISVVLSRLACLPLRRILNCLVGVAWDTLSYGCTITS